MATVRTEVSEIVTGLGLFGYRDLERALAARPRSINNVTDRVFDRLDAAYETGKHLEIFSSAYANGEIFARANVGLRGRVPWLVEWKGPHRPPAYEQIPADLRVDHVYLISCKYGSDILHNASPWHVFDRALAERAKRGADWFAEVAAESFQEFYSQVRNHVSDLPLPTRVTALNANHRAALRSALKGRWPASLRYDWELVGFEIARNSASHLMERTSQQERSRGTVLEASAPRSLPIFRARHRQERLPDSLPGDDSVGLPESLFVCDISTCGATMQVNRPFAGGQRWSTRETQRQGLWKVMLRSVGVTANSQEYPKPRSISTLRTMTWPATNRSTAATDQPQPKVERAFLIKARAK